MTAAYFEDRPTDPEKVILRKPKHDYGLSPRHALDEARQRTWVELTDEDKDFIAKRASVYDWHDYEVIEATEAKLKEKNNG